MIFALGVLVSVLLYALGAVYAERKIAAFIQDRLGPMETGKYGFLQTAADFIKIIQKENIIPSKADKFIFSLSPLIIFTVVYAAFSAVPFSPHLVPSDIRLGALFVIAVISIDVLGFLMAGWSSNNKYGIYGGLRAVAQIISYEIPLVITVLSVTLLVQSLNLQYISLHQGTLSPEPIKFMGIFSVNDIGGFMAWHIFQAPHLTGAFFIYFISSLAQCNRAPFDIPEAESELVAGFHVEYSGIRFALIFLAEYASMLFVSIFAAVLFLGGWNTVLPNIGTLKLADYTTGMWWGIFWLLFKSGFLVLVQMWIRWTLPRFRLDQLISFCWKILTPASFICLFISALWRLLII